MTLTPYTAGWTPREAAHLLRRTTFGFSYAQLQEAVAAGLDATLDTLLAAAPPPPPPLSNGNSREPTPGGQTWVDQPYSSENLMGSVVSRIFSLSNWQGRLMLEEGISLRETMVLFWHNHFAINTAVEPKYNYRYLQTLRKHVFGDFRQLVKDINVDPLMLTFLNGNDNTAVAPNENYARELLELFTLGKGPQVGPDDYTNYTEQDVRAMARILTGWRDYGFNATDTGDFGSRFVARRHDPRPVQLSHRFDNATVNFSGETAHEQLTDFILEREEVSRFMVRNFYRWFVYYDITPAIETEVIEPLAALFRAEDYRVEPVLRALFASEHFFAVDQRGPMIKNPYDFAFGMIKACEVTTEGSNLRQTESIGQALGGPIRDMGMTYFTPPNVAGWKAYYQEPLYYRTWINSATLPFRQRYAETLLTTGFEVPRLGAIQAEILLIVEQFPEPGELIPLLEQLVLLFLPQPASEGLKTYLRDLLLPGLPDTQWTVEYANYRANPNDATLRAALETKLRRTVLGIFNLPEFQLS